MAQKVLPTFAKVKKAFSPFTKRAITPSFSSSSTSFSTGSSSIDDKLNKDQAELKLPKIDCEEQRKEFFDSLLIDVTYKRPLSFIFFVSDLIDAELAVLNAKMIECGFDLGEATARRKSRILFSNFVSKQEVRCAKQMDQLEREIEFYQKLKSVFEDLIKTRIKQIRFMKKLQQERISSQQTVVLAQQ